MDQLTARGSMVSLAAAAVTLSLGFLRSVALARLLLPEHFGVVALAMFYVVVVSQLRSFGLAQAYIHRQNAEERLYRTFITLSIVLLGLQVASLLIAAPLLGRLYPDMPSLTLILVALAGIEIVKGVTAVQETFLRQDLAFRHLALADVIASVVMTTVAPPLAWIGWGMWALVAEQGSGALARLAAIWAPRGRSPLRLGWDQATVHWFWEYGKLNWGASSLTLVTSRFDDFWIGTLLGGASLGYYSRAYEFAQYPRRIIANPLLNVFHPVFARLQGNRYSLSQAFNRVNYVILRGGFFVTGAFALIMPEFIHLVIGDQWMPMLVTFRLLLIYALLDAVLLVGGSLLLAVGRPRDRWRVAAAQSVFFVPAVVAGAHFAGINGVALAANGMAVVGAVLQYRYLRRVIDFSLTRLAAWPTVAVALAFGSGMVLEMTLNAIHPLERAVAKFALYSVVFLTMLMSVEGRMMLEELRWVRTNLVTGSRWTWRGSVR